MNLGSKHKLLSYISMSFQNVQNKSSTSKTLKVIPKHILELKNKLNLPRTLADLILPVGS